MADPITRALIDAAARRKAAIHRLDENLRAFDRAISSDPKNEPFLGKVKLLVAEAKRALQRSASRSMTDRESGLVATTESILEAGRNAYRTLADQGGITTQQTAVYASIGALFNDTFCTLKTATARTQTMLDVSDALGASNCSSTGGGEPSSVLAGKNAFELLFQANNAAVRLSSIAVAHIGNWRVDVLGQSGAAATAINSMRDIAAGLVVSEL